MKSPVLAGLLASLMMLEPNMRAAATSADLVRVPDAERPGAAAVRVAAAVPLVFTAKLFAADVSRDAAGQAEQILDQLDALLRNAGADVHRLVRLNLYVVDDRSTAQIEAVLARRLADAPPVTTWVQSTLEQAGARVAIDAVAAGSRPVSAVQIADARAAIVPAGGKVFISGQASRADTLVAGVAQTMAGLHRTLEHLGLRKADVVHVKAFVHSMADHAAVHAEIARTFDGGPVPPIVLTEWSSTTPPAEIELIVAGTPSGIKPEPVSYLPLPDLPTSPVFSRVAAVGAGTPLIFLGAIDGGAGGAPREQWKRVFARLGGTLLDAGSSFRHLVKATYYLADPVARAALGEIRAVYFDPARPPAASAADVKGLGRPGHVLLDMIAVPARPE